MRSFDEVFAAREVSPVGTEWREQALCRQTDPEAFFPLPNADASAAVAVCRRCPVQPECLAEALDQREEFGVWGGMTEQERRALRRAVTA